MILKIAQSSNCFTFQYFAHFLKFQISKTKQPTKNGQITLTDRRVIWWMREMEKDIERQRTWGAAADSVSHCLTVHHWRSIDSSRLVTAPVLCRTASWQGWDDERLVRVDICITGAVVVVESGMSCWADTAWYWEPLPGLVRPLYSHHWLYRTQPDFILVTNSRGSFQPGKALMSGIFLTEIKFTK